MLYVTTLSTLLQIGMLSPAIVAITFFSGLLLAWLRVRGGTIVLPATLHATAVVSLNLLWPLVIR